MTVSMRQQGTGLPQRAFVARPGWHHRQIEEQESKGRRRIPWAVIKDGMGPLSPGGSFIPFMYRMSISHEARQATWKGVSGRKAKLKIPNTCFALTPCTCFLNNFGYTQLQMMIKQLMTHYSLSLHGMS